MARLFVRISTLAAALALAACASAPPGGTETTTDPRLPNAPRDHLPREVEMLSVPAETALVYLATATVRGAAELEKVWPGYVLRDKPFILYSPSDRTQALLLNHPSPPEGAVPLKGPDLPPELAEGVLHYRGPLSTLEQSIDRKQQMGFDGYVHLRQVAEDDLFQSVDFVFHEGFHPYQRQHFADFLCTQVELDEANVTSETFVAEVERERELLLAALDASSRDRLRDVAHEYLAVRHRRLREFPKLRWHERHLERQEGTARWVGYSVALRALDRDPAQIAGHVADDLRQAFSEMPQGPGVAAPLTRWRLYGTGAALSVILERLGVDWRSQVQGGAFLDELVAEAVGFAPPPGALPDADIRCFNFSDVQGG